MRRYTYFLLVLVGLSGLFSCVQDEMPDKFNPNTTNPDGFIRIHMSMPELRSPDSRSASTRAMNDAAERDIDENKLNILVFKKEGSDEKFAYKAPLSGSVEYNDNDKTKAMITVKLMQSTIGEQYRLVIIANHDIVGGSIATGTLKSEVLEQLTYSVAGKWNADNNGYMLFPMWGETELVTVSSSMPSQSVSLYRALARIDIGLGFNTDGGTLLEEAAGLSDFTLKEIKVYRTYQKGYVAPLNSSMSQPYTTPFVPSDAVRNADNAPLTYAIADAAGASKYVREIYIPEVNLPSSPSNDNMHSIVVGGYYKGNTSIMYYRLDFATEDATTGNRSYLPVLRNHRYVFNISEVRGPGFISPEAALQSTGTIEKMDYELIVWEEHIHKMEVQGKYYFGLEQGQIILSPEINSSTKALFYQTNLPADSVVKYEWKKGEMSPFTVQPIPGKKFIITAKHDNTTNQIITDTLFVKAGPFTISLPVSQRYVNFKYTINCEDVKVLGTYKNGEALNPLIHTITFTITAEDNTIIGKPYELVTEDLEGNHGISFSANGVFSSVSQTITMRGSGTLTNTSIDEPFKLRIKSNSSSGSYCEATINPVDQAMNIVVLANTDGSGFDISMPAWGTNKLLTHPNNFGSNDNSIVKVGEYNFISSTIYNFSLYTSSEPYKWITGIGNNGKIADMVYIAYAAVFNANTAQLLVDYIKKGGVVVAFIEEVSTVQYLMNALFEQSGITAAAVGAAGNVYPFPAHPSFNLSSQELETVLRDYEKDPILNGPFGDARDKQWGEDRSATIGINDLPLDANVTIYSYINDLSTPSPNMSNRQVSGFKYESEDKNLIFFGDGGFMASGTGSPYADPNGFPFYWDTNTMFPIPKPVYGHNLYHRWEVYNSIVFCNIMAWAIRKSQSLKAKREL